MHRRPCQVFRTRPSFLWKNAGRHQQVQSRAKQLKRVEAALARLGSIQIILYGIGSQECGPEKTPLGEGEFEISCADCA